MSNPYYESEKATLNAQYPLARSSSGPSNNSGTLAFPPENLDQPPSYEIATLRANADSALAAPGGGFNSLYAGTTDTQSPSTQHTDSATPPSFSRHVPLTIDCTVFNPMYLTMKKKRLASGFPICPPPVHTGSAQAHQHPFASRDVTQDDWSWFLNDVNAAAQLNLKQKSVKILLAFVAPSMDIVAGQVYLSQQKKAIGVLVDMWNHVRLSHFHLF
jgi:hypothetical protein